MWRERNLTLHVCVIGVESVGMFVGNNGRLRALEQALTSFLWRDKSCRGLVRHGSNRRLGWVRGAPSRRGFVDQVDA